MTKSDELRQAAELLEFWFNMEADNETARDEEDRDPEYTKVIKAALTVSKYMRKHLAATQPDEVWGLRVSDRDTVHRFHSKADRQTWLNGSCSHFPLNSNAPCVEAARSTGEFVDHPPFVQNMPQPDDDGRDWRSIAITLYERAVWFFHRKSEEFKSKPELDKITQANGCEGWISTLAANWHNDFASDLSQIMPPEIGMPVPDEGGPIDEEGHWSTGLFTVEVFRYSSRYAVMLSDCDNEVVEDLHHIKTKAQLRKLLEALGAK